MDYQCDVLDIEILEFEEYDLIVEGEEEKEFFVFENNEDFLMFIIGD